MKLWIFLSSSLYALRSGFSRKRTFLWFCIAVCALCTRSDLAGVTSFVRCLGLDPRYYHSLLGLFASSAVKLDTLTSLWVQYVLSQAQLIRVGGRAIILADGIKVPKEGKKMPGVKSLYQDSQSNSKAAFIMGHSIQALSLLCGTPESAIAIPLAARIHEGVVVSNRSKKTLPDKVIELLASLALNTDCMVVADAYYAAATVIFQLQSRDTHLLSRVQRNAVAYKLPLPEKKKRRGRPRKYGEKVVLRTLFEKPELFTAVPSPVYGESNTTIHYLVQDLLWKPVKEIVRFILVIHPQRGRMILLTTDLNIDPLIAIQTYALRFKIEVSFKAAIHSLGVYSYHFWSAIMKPVKRRGGTQYLHRESSEYRTAILRKLHTFNVFIQVGLIAHGILNLIALKYQDLVWKHFGSWIRTIRPGVLPSELVVKSALRNTMPEFLTTSHEYDEVRKFFLERMDEQRGSSILRAA